MFRLHDEKYRAVGAVDPASVYIPSNLAVTCIDLQCYHRQIPVQLTEHLTDPWKGPILLDNNNKSADISRLLAVSPCAIYLVGTYNIIVARLLIGKVHYQ